MKMIESIFDKKKTIYEMNMDELRDEIFEITKKQNQLSYFGLSKDTYNKAKQELQEKKSDMIKQMHVLVDEL